MFISACFIDTYTPYTSEVYACEKRALKSKRLRYLKFINSLIFKPKQKKEEKIKTIFLLLSHKQINACTQLVNFSHLKIMREKEANLFEIYP